MEFTAVDTVMPVSNPQTLFQVRAPSDYYVTILRIDLGLQGATPASTPILFDIVTQTSAGTASALIPQHVDRSRSETIQATLLQDFTAEPVLGALLHICSYHPQSAVLLNWPGDIKVKGDERVGFRYRSGTFVQVTFTVHMEI